MPLFLPARCHHAHNMLLLSCYARRARYADICCRDAMRALAPRFDASCLASAVLRYSVRVARARDAPRHAY